MSNETEQKIPVSFGSEEKLSDLKQEFSKIFYDYSLDNFADASELGFLDFSKPAQKLQTIPKGEKDIVFESLGTLSNADQKEDFHEINKFDEPFSSATLFPSDINLPTNGSNNGNPKQSISQGALTIQAKTSEQGRDLSDVEKLRGLFQSQEYIDTYEDQPLSLIWTTESSKPSKQKIQNSPTKLPPIKKEYSAEYLPKSFESVEPYNYDFLSLENSQDNSRSERIFSKMPGLKREESESGQFISDQFVQLEKNIMIKGSNQDKTALVPKKVSWEEPSRKRSDSFQDDDDKFDPNSDKARSSRGLRVLSLKVKDIVGEKKRTSYKEVAECLIDELGQKLKGKLQGESKDEQNVKRRVYDALNVLIAADILKKEGKAVFCDDKVVNIGAHKRKILKDEKEKLEIKIFDIKKRKKNKTQVLQELVYKCMAIKNLIKRNKEQELNQQVVKKLDLESEAEERTQSQKQIASQTNAMKIGVNKNSPSFKSKNEDVIKFPFIVLVSTSLENSMNLNMNSHQNKLSIESSCPFHIYGDIDVLLNLHLQHVSQDFFRENIPQEIDKFLPKAYLDSLK